MPLGRTYIQADSGLITPEQTLMMHKANYQALLERAFSGGNRNPLNRPEISNTGNNWEKEGDKLPLSTFAGLATWIPERSAIQGKPAFCNLFQLR